MKPHSISIGDRGIAIPLVLLVLVVLGLVTAAAAYMSTGDTRIATLYSTSNRIAAASAAGLEDGVDAYGVRYAAWDASGGTPLTDFVMTAGWPINGSVDGYDYSVSAQRDSFDFDGDGTKEAVSCEPDTTGGNGNGNGNGNNGNGNGSSDGGDGTGLGQAPGGDSGDYWTDGSGKDKNGDGNQGLSGGHFDPDVFTAGNKHQYHQHEFDDKYDTTKVEVVDDPHLLWSDIIGPDYPDPLRITWMNKDNAPGWYEITLKNKTIENYNNQAQEVVVQPDQVEHFRIQFTNLQGFSCTDPGSVKKDDVNRSGAFTVRVYDNKTGVLAYELSVYWHNKADDCTADPSQDNGSSPDKGAAADSTDNNQDPKKAADYCKKWSEHLAKGDEHTAKADEWAAKAEAKEAEGKKANKERKEEQKERDKAAQEYAEAEKDCERAQSYGDCACSATPPDDSSTPADSTGSTSAPSCTINGDDKGSPVFVLTSTATRGVYQATQRMRVTSDESSGRLLRLSWMAN